MLMPFNKQYKEKVLHFYEVLILMNSRQQKLFEVSNSLFRKDK